MTRFVTYDPEVAARLAQAVGVHRVDLRDPEKTTRKGNPALLDAVHDKQRSAVLMPSRDEQVLLIRVNDQDEENESQTRAAKKRGKKVRPEQDEMISQPSGFLGLHDEAVLSEDPEDPPRSLWKNDE